MNSLIILVWFLKTSGINLTTITFSIDFESHNDNHYVDIKFEWLSLSEWQRFNLNLKLKLVFYLYSFSYCQLYWKPNGYSKAHADLDKSLKRMFLD